MKTFRFSSVFIRTAAVLLAGLLAGVPAASRSVHIGKLKISWADSKELAKALAQQTGEVQQRFDDKRRALHTMEGLNGQPAYALQDVAGLVTGTANDLDQAIASVGDPRLAGLRAWSAEELRPIAEQLAAPAGRTAALPAGLFAPRAVAVVASLGWLPLRDLASAKAVAPKKASPKQTAPEAATIAAEKANGLLDRVGEVVGRIFFLASHDDLETNLWVGSTPAKRVLFSFWPQGTIKGSPQAAMILRTDDHKDHVPRGLYSYRAAWSKGPVTDVIEYPNSAAQQATEQLDLVMGSGFFCCDFSGHFCRQVANEKACRS